MSSKSDFFDSVLEVDGGDEFVRALARRLGRFDWSHVEQDVMKVLYQSVIGAETRKRLGEYYTPDWLAEAMVEKMIAHPLEMRVLDTACGSGTFLFHAIRHYIAAAERKSLALADILASVTRHVLGMDLHPVAVTLARVTYLLAIGRERLTDPARATIQVPVYLGESIQWQEQQLDLWTSGNLVIHADDKKELFSTELRFPDSLLENRLYSTTRQRACHSRLDEEERRSRSPAHLALPATRYPAQRPRYDRRDLQDHVSPSRRGSRSHLGLLRPQPRTAPVARTRQEPRRCPYR